MQPMLYSSVALAMPSAASITSGNASVADTSRYAYVFAPCHAAASSSIVFIAELSMGCAWPSNHTARRKTAAVSW